MPPKLKQSITAHALLEADENAVITFLTKSHRGSRFDISGIVDFNKLSTDKCEELSEKLM